VLVLGPPRSGKTTSLVIPNTLLAPGAVVSTSTKPDVIAATCSVRRDMGRCWLFDPLGTAPPPPGVTQLRWSPVPACRDWEAAVLTARAMTLAARPSGYLGEQAHWTERAEALLAPLLHAAALREGGMSQVVSWVNRRCFEVPAAVVGLKGSPLARDILLGLALTEERELSGIFSTASGVLAAYRSQVALDQADDPNFDPAQLPASADTVYVCAPSHHQAVAAPLVVGLIEQVRSSAYRSAGWHAPVTLVLDEAANIAPLPDLPSIVAEGGSQGLVTIACFQDLSQARSRWGQAAHGFLSLFGVKVVLPGIADVATLEQISRLAGDHDVVTRSVTRRPFPIGRHGGGASVTLSTRRQPRLPVDAIAHLPPSTAIVLEGRSPPTWLRLTPWFQTPPFVEARPGFERPQPRRMPRQAGFGRSL
jgi:type IV secretory pathway TraG/TraD family ATPase VirD4